MEGEIESRLLAELTEIDQDEERALADEALAADEQWPDY